MNKTDFLGQKLGIGDKVVFMTIKYRDFDIGKIISMAEKSALIEHKKNNRCRSQTRQYYSQIIKHNKQ